MIRTFTLNPAVDVSLTVRELVPIHKNRATHAIREAGGGGVNVARLLVRLGAEVECVVAVGGATGAEVVDALVDLDVEVIELAVVGSTRESVQIHDLHNDVRYRVAVDGPVFSSATSIRTRLSGRRRPEVNVLSGSLPPGCPTSIYSDLSIIDPTAFTIVDTSGDALRECLTGSVDLIKPSLRELEGLVDHEIADAERLEKSLADVLDSHDGLQSILVSLGAAGAVLGQRGRQPIRLAAPTTTVVSAVGAGDSLVAGVAWGLSRGEDLLTSCRLGVAAGTATVATPGTSLCSAEAALDLLRRVGVSTLHPDDSIR